MKLSTITQTYNDGIADIYSVKNSAANGDFPIEVLELKIKTLCYQELTVGMGRFWEASQENTKIERLLRIPRINIIKRGDVIIPIDGEQYKIVQIQFPKGIVPASMDISLERVESTYGFE